MNGVAGLERAGAPVAAGRLDGLRALLSVDDGQTEGRPARLRVGLEQWLASEAAEGDPAVAEALRRLALLTEVWECVAAESPGTADPLPGFFTDAIGRLVGGDPPGAAAWIVEESAARWGDYLVLVDPSLAPEPAPDDPTGSLDGSLWGEDGGPAIDQSELLRRLLGAAGATAPEAPVDPPIAGPTGADSEGDGEGPVADEEPAEPVDAAGSDPLAEARALKLDAELREVFVADVSDLFGRLQGLVLGLGGDDVGALREIGRCLHTLKGAAGSVGLGGLAATIHALEDELEAAGGAVTDGLSGRLEGMLTLLEGVVAAVGGAASEGAAPAGAAPAATEGDAANGHAGAGDALLRVTESRFDELMDIASELLTRRRTWAERAEQMKQLVTAARACSQRLRGSVERLGDAAPRGRACGRTATGAGDPLDGLIRRLAEQVEDLAALAATARELSTPMAADAEDLSRLSLRLWDGLGAVRFVPVRGLFQRLVRVARDAARVEGRTVEVGLIGEETAADRLLVDKVYEPLLHLVRNAVGHGIEPAEERARAGKPPCGRIALEARREGNALVLAVRDDGRGLDLEAIAAKGRRLGLIGPDERPGPDRLHALIFTPGFSTRGRANAISGRGVGMDVVAREVELLRGRIALSSEAGRGTRVEVVLPARLSLEHVMVVRIVGQPFAVPTAALEAIQRADRVGHDGPGAAAAAIVAGCRLPMVDLGAALGFSSTARESRPMVLVSRSDGEPIALRVDGVDGPRELVVKPLGPLLAGHPALSGAGMTTGGDVIPVIDVAGLLRLTRAGARQAEPPEPSPDSRRPAALVVDDSLSVRRVATRILRSLGFEVDEAADGEQALGRLRDREYRLVLTDLEMPRMDGFALLAELGRTGALEATRVVVASTLADPETRRRVHDLGAAGFVAKPVDAERLAAAVGPLLGDRPHPTAAGSPAAERLPEPIE